MAIATKEQLTARVQELEAQLAFARQEANMVSLIGLVKAIKQIPSRYADAPLAVSGILVNTTTERIGDHEIKVDLPVDGLYARDNESNLVASQLLDLANSTRWARVRVSGYWKVVNPQGTGIVRDDRGYYKATRRELRVMRVEVLNAEWLEQAEQPAPAAAAPAPARTPVAAGYAPITERDDDVPF